MPHNYHNNCDSLMALKICYFLTVIVKAEFVTNVLNLQV